MSEDLPRCAAACLGCFWLRSFKFGDSLRARHCGQATKSQFPLSSPSPVSTLFPLRD
ncbi:hypothetical protein GE21DRAFT_1046292 [Neurospora crassa]|nr:hypothetical protein GE21DRAFT_1046292 [Neurospora crassa]